MPGNFYLNPAKKKLLKTFYFFNQIVHLPQINTNSYMDEVPLYRFHDLLTLS
jgi:hypothetical protein